MIDLQLQYATQSSNLPEASRIESWLRAATPPEMDKVIVGIRIVDEEESADLNGRYRSKPYPTNVLSFPYDGPDFSDWEDIDDDDVLPEPELGDLVICAPVVEREAAEQGKTLEAHWAHMVIHGVLHLLGYDHLDDAEADVMESREREILAGLGFPDPYAADQTP